MRVQRLAWGAMMVAACSGGEDLTPELDAEFRASCPFGGAGEPDEAAVFAQVRHDAPFDTSIRDYVIDLINATPGGADLRGTTYTFDGEAPIADALNAAANRGVNVRLVFDDNDRSTSQIAALNPLIDTTVCNGACMYDATDAGIQHTKLFTMSEVCNGAGAAHDVSVVSSANWTGGMRSMHNAMVVIRNDAGLYEGYSQHIDDMVDAEVGGHHDPQYYEVFDGSDDAYRGFAFPRAPDGGEAPQDTIVEIIGDVDCTGNGEIRIAMAYWDDERTEILYDALLPKAAEGCTVELVVGDDEARNQEFINDHLSEVACAAHPGAPCTNGGINYRLLADGELHSKYLIVNARYEGSVSKQQIVVTGSQNYREGGLVRWDESLLMARSSSLYGAFKSNFDHLWARGYGGVEGDGEFCSESNPCLNEQGDCDSDTECAYKGDCRKDAADEIDPGRPGWLDVCLTPGHWHFCKEGERECSAGEGDCDVTADCKPGVTCHQFVGVDICQDYQGTHACNETPCGLGEGDCDNDQHCEDGLKCVQYSSSTGYTWNADYCMAPMMSGYCSPLSPCGFGEGHCADSSQCEPGLTCTEAGAVDVCRPSNGEDCSPQSPCDLSEGDCDSDADCAQGECRQFTGSNPDSCLFNGGGSFCDAANPCGIGEGDCDVDAQCDAGLYCVQFRDDRVGFNTDYCLPAGHAEFCQVSSPCDEGQGDCDTDADCRPGLSCVEGGVIDTCQ